MKVNFNSRANREVRSITEYYTIEAGIKHAKAFLDELDEVIRRIKISPQTYPSIETNIHRALLSKYPYVVLYEIESHKCVRILAIRHQRQNPDLALVS